MSFWAIDYDLNADAMMLLLGVVLAVAMLDPGKPIPGTQWHPWLWLREIVQIILVGLSLIVGSQAVRRDNHFTYAAIVEVAVLFLGIFVCMTIRPRATNCRLSC